MCPWPTMSMHNLPFIKICQMNGAEEKEKNCHESQIKISDATCEKWRAFGRGKNEKKKMFICVYVRVIMYTNSPI